MDQKSGAVTLSLRDISVLIGIVLVALAGRGYIDSSHDAIAERVNSVEKTLIEKINSGDSRFAQFLAQDAEHEKACSEDKGRMKSDIQDALDKNLEQDKMIYELLRELDKRGAQVDGDFKYPVFSRGTINTNDPGL